MSATPRALPNGHYHARPNGLNCSARRGVSMTRDGAFGSGPGAVPASEEEREEDAIQKMLKAKWAETEANIAALFGAAGTRRASKRPAAAMSADHATTDPGPQSNAKTSVPPKKAARQIDDDYGDEDDEDEEDEATKESPLKAKGKAALPNGFSPFAVRSPLPVGRPSAVPNTTSSSLEVAKSSEDVRKQLEEDKRAASEAAARSFQSMFYTFENDQNAMLEQQKLDDLDREVEDEVAGGAKGAQQSAQRPGGGSGAAAGQGLLGQADLGGAGLALKHLVARLDKYPEKRPPGVTDAQLKTLIADVRKGRSKWASDDKVGQEDLYEALERVLHELKAMTEYVQPFLTKVSKREAPDYFNVIRHPMDIGTMMKKLKQLAFKSKQEFVDDLTLIWSNCLRYNQDPAHPLRKKALFMRGKADKLLRLIPDVTVRDRAEVEAEERRMHGADGDDSDDDDAPIMASRGRKAPKKGSTKGPQPAARKMAPTVNVEDQASTPAPDVKPVMHPSASNLRHEFLRAESELHDASSAGFSTPPPPGTATPMGINGVHGSGAPGSQADVMEVDGAGFANSTPDDADEDDTEFKTWKQITKKDRALMAQERHRLFRGERLTQLDPDEPALLRNKAMMRRWLRQQKITANEAQVVEGDALEGEGGDEQQAQGGTLAEGIEKDEDSTLPDYYNPLSAIPDLDLRWKWTTDSEGHVVPHTEEWMRIYPKEHFKSAGGSLSRKMEANMRQMQDTRKICAKIGVVKQMQIQAQTYQNQFQKYEPQPFLEQDVGTVVVSESGPLMAPWVCRSALQRTVGKIFYHAGFEDFQPSALDTATDLASNFFTRIVDAFKCFREQPRADAETPRFSFEEQALHSLHENGLDLEALESYVKDDVERLSTKLDVVHERMKSHLADLLRPALGDNVGVDGVGAFNDGSEQFVGGDFAEDLDEDFFGFRELGLAQELGLETLSVPLHLLQNRMHNAYQAQNQGPVTTTGLVFEPPPPYEAINVDTLPSQIGIVQDYFRGKLRLNHDKALIEDEDLPTKQKFPKPRLPPTGKISSPRKRPIREQQQAAKKKRKLEESEGKDKALQPPLSKLRLEMPEPKENGVDPEKNHDANGAMISPESLEAN